MPNAYLSEGAKEFAAHVAGAAKSVVKVGAEVAEFVKDEAAKLTGLKADLEKDLADAAVVVADVESGNVAGAVAAAGSLAIDAQATVSDASVVQADAKAANLPV